MLLSCNKRGGIPVHAVLKGRSSLFINVMFSRVGRTNTIAWYSAIGQVPGERACGVPSVLAHRQCAMPPHVLPR